MLTVPLFLLLQKRRRGRRIDKIINYSSSGKRKMQHEIPPPPKRNGSLRKHREHPKTIHMTGALGPGCDTGELAEDIAAKFLNSGRERMEIIFHHYRLTYTRQEMEDRVKNLQTIGEKISAYGIPITARIGEYEYVMVMFI